MSTLPPVSQPLVADRTDIPTAWDERSILLTLLDYVRATVHEKCEGLSDADAARRPLPTSPKMSVSAMVNHLRWVEEHWFATVFLGEPSRHPATDEDPDAEMTMAASIPLSTLLEEYAVACARFRDLAATLDLDHPSVRKDAETGEPVTLRYVILHIIEETARHNGHIDIIRELVDGTTGA